MLALLECKIPPPIIAIFFGCLAFIFERHGSLYDFGEALLSKAVALVSLFLALIIAVLGLWEFWKLRTTVNPHSPQKTTKLSTSGIYQYTRNPIYLGIVLALLAWCMWLGELSTFIVIPFCIGTLQRFQIIPEEQILSAKFGTNYINYKNKVGRWL